MKMCMISLRPLILAGLFWASTLLAQLPAGVERQLTDLSSTDLDIRMRALSQLLRPYSNPGQEDSLAAWNLTRAYPAQTERIKETLIAALDREAAELERLQSLGDTPSEGQGEHWHELSIAVSSLRDLRAVRPLLRATGPGGVALSFFADLCPAVIPILIETSTQPPSYWRGILITNYKARAMVMFGLCLTRMEAMRAAPDALNTVRGILLSALDDPDPFVRKAAAQSFRPLPNDPEIRRKL